MIRKRLILVLSLIAVFFLDGQLSFLVSSMTQFRWLVTSQLLLLILFYLSALGHDLLTYLLLAGLGLFYDQHYIMSLGLATLLFPVIYAFLCLGRRFWLKAFWDRAFILFCLHLVFPIALYLLGRSYGLTRAGFEHFISHQLLGTLLFNMALSVIIIRYVEPLVFSTADFRQISTEL